MQMDRRSSEGAEVILSVASLTVPRRSPCIVVGSTMSESNYSFVFNVWPLQAASLVCLHDHSMITLRLPHISCRVSFDANDSTHIPSSLLTSGSVRCCKRGAC